MRIEELNKEKHSLILYMRSKIEVEDWHAVADAAMDIREVEAKIELLNALTIKGDFDVSQKWKV